MNAPQFEVHYIMNLRKYRQTVTFDNLLADGYLPYQTEQAERDVLLARLDNMATEKDLMKHFGL